ncbi:hypothetical protein [Roseicella aquatilis]|uniref:Uncharacterized protein n=1 Tax=Roseicella aquatilis TaxID=2527868 RepID=A0A4R4DB95_9PROT|nr:hypothetical protein [Roseicella aquatilis]TCZ56706.1 hypothetical protein EXY23_19165 [Roseicella aquatilis]
MRRLALLLPLLASPALAQVQTVSNAAPDIILNLLNRDPAAMHEIHVSPAGSRDWGPDRLGAFVLVPGRAARIALAPGQCLHDIRVVFADGRVAERRGVDACATPRMALP